MKTIVQIIIGVLLTCIHCSAQNTQINPIDLRAFSDNQFVIGITQDDQGYIWIADFQSGMSRYDGTEMKRYTAKGGSNLGPTSNRSECITSDGKNIWLGTFGSGLNKLDPETGLFTHYTHDPADSTTIRSNHIRTLAFDQEGMLWIGTLTGLDKFDPTTETFTHVHTTDPDEDVLRYEHVRALYVDKAGVVWVGTSSPFANEGTVGGLFKVEVDKNSITHYQSSEAENTLIDSKVRAIFEDSRGTFWVGTAGDGLHIMDRKSGTFTRFQFDPSDPLKVSRSTTIDGRQTAIDHITFINEDDGGNIWIGTFNGGLNMYDPITKRMTYHAQALPFEHQKIGANGFWASYKAKDGLLWISTWPFLAADEIFYNITSKSRKIEISTLEYNSSVRSFVNDGKGGFYYGGSDGIWHEDKFGNTQLISRIEGFDNSTRAGARDIVVKDGQLWIATNQGLYNIEITTKKLNIYDHDPLDPTTLSTNILESIALLEGDELLLGSINGIQIFNTETKKSRQLQLFDNKEREPFIEQIGEVTIDSKNRTWITPVWKGIRQLDIKTGNLIKYPEIPDGENITYVFEDSNQKIWIGGDGGVYTLNESTNKFEIYRDKNGLVAQQRISFSIAEDSQKQLWLTTGSGVAKIDLKSEDSKYFGASWGINNWNFTTRGAFGTPNGDMIFGDGNGYYRFNSDDLEVEDKQTTLPFTSEYFINETKVSDINDRIQRNDTDNDILHLNHSENSFSFTVNQIDYLSSKSDRVLQYRLEGHDPNWREIDSGDRVLFYNVSPGNYVFQSKVFDINGEWQEYNMDVRISPPWWKTWWAYVLYGLAAILLGSAVYRDQKNRTVRIEREKTKDRELAQAKEIEKAYTDLKSTQAQLVQSEKMASLGELTAGIAHEIQNPLNFVNNFSDVSGELIEEALGEFTSTPLSEQNIVEVKDILSDLKGNLEKISHHGGRASSIVKGMLDHSRASSDEKVPTDINALCDEYLRLSYHGLRAKDKSFNSDFKTEFDNDLPLIEVVPQDVGRVILNIINNAFYACAERSRSAVSSTSLRDQTNYKPLVTITTSKSNPNNGYTNTRITITDNGSGIPKELIDKVFQPFFTTKPTGSGTGLGLSISYDIIKAHNGNLKVDSSTEGTTFTITLPINENKK